MPSLGYVRKWTLAEVEAVSDDLAEAQRRQERREREARHETPEAGAEVSAAGAFLSKGSCGGAVVV